MNKHTHIIYIALIAGATLAIAFNITYTITRENVQSLNLVKESAYKR